MTIAETRTKAVVIHTTPSKHQFLRICAAEAGMTISTFAETIIAEHLSKVEKNNNPFSMQKNKQ